MAVDGDVNAGAGTGQLANPIVESRRVTSRHNIPMFLDSTDYGFWPWLFFNNLSSMVGDRRVIRPVINLFHQSPEVVFWDK